MKTNKTTKRKGKEKTTKDMNINLEETTKEQFRF